ncbi:hypothetical protein [Frankia nepalensis]|uniref:Uncharacterized protein n=1 Tax=Frankia nepalensis TaxID=1836974 RepID=A0A937RRW2_9ACTN|nr:hypothetical protein [Frankia nepalensis]MBL7502625.1 hypothetical protein [Frankia nepalensis]MBL7632229.1 hypothetical protein [Frankia nepalensis]
MSGNPAIHRRPSGDVDIAVPQDEPEPQLDAPGASSNNAPSEAGFSGSPATGE